MTDLVPLLTQATAIVGTTGAGKSYTAHGAVEQLLEQGRRVVIIDPTGVWWGLRSAAEDDPDGVGYPVTIFGGEHADIAITEHDGKVIADAIAQRHVQCIIDVSEMSGGEQVRFLTDFFETLYTKNKGALQLGAGWLGVAINRAFCGDQIRIGLAHVDKLLELCGAIGRRLGILELIS